MLVYAILSTCKFGTRISISMEVSKKESKVCTVLTHWQMCPQFSLWLAADPKNTQSSQVAHDSLDSSTSQHVLGMGHDDSRNPLVE